jgi:hypothetical protein
LDVIPVQYYLIRGEVRMARVFEGLFFRFRKVVTSGSAFGRVFNEGRIKTVSVLSVIALALLAPGIAADSLAFDPGQFGNTSMRSDSGTLKNGQMLASGLVGSRMYELASARPSFPPAIPPLYTSPALAGEGVWHWKDMPTTDDGQPVIFRTTYRPSVEFPNAVAHMFLFDMKHMSTRLYVGSAEEGGSAASSQIDKQDRQNVLAVTNGLWKTRHSGGGGIIFRGKVIKKLAPGFATIIVYKDQSVDIVEWNDSMPTSEIMDARQLKHLIVSDGKVVESVKRGNRTVDAEIGLGSLLDESRPLQADPADPSGAKVMNFTSGPNWFLATRSGFGIRKDGNLVFAIGHHISTKDLAKALALAGCVRAIHADANPGNCVGAAYRIDDSGKVLGVEKLSPQQNDPMSKRYVTGPVQSDFYAFFKKSEKPSVQ